MATIDRINGLTDGVAIKPACRVATTANIILSGEQTINGVAVVAGDRVLVKDQEAGVDNGIWIAAISAWSRATDFDGARDVVEGTAVIVTDGGTTYDNSTMWIVATPNPVIGTSEISFVAAPGVDGQGGVRFPTLDAVADTNIPAMVIYFRTAGRSAPGDGEDGLYIRVDAEPLHSEKVQSADGAWWELKAPSTRQIGRGSVSLLPEIIILVTGQSNAVGGSAAAGGDTTSDPDVLIWNPTTKTWGVATIGVAPLAVPNNFALHQGKKLHADTGQRVGIILVASGGQPLERWDPDDATPTMATRILTEVPEALAAAGSQKVSRISIAQGEANNATGPMVYARLAIRVVDHWRAQPWWLPGHTSVLAITLLDKPAEAGPTGGERAQNVGWQLASEMDPDIGVVSVFDLSNMTGDRLHYNGAALVEIGKRLGRAAQCPTPALPRLTRMRVVGDDLLITCGTTGTVDFSNIGDVFEFISTLVAMPRARIRCTIKAGQWEIPAYGSFPVGWHCGNNVEFYGEVAGGYAIPLKTDFTGVAATDLAMLRGKYLTELVATASALIATGYAGYWEKFLISGNGSALNHGLRTDESQIPCVGGAFITLREVAWHGFNNASAFGVLVEKAGSRVELTSCTLSHCTGGVFTDGGRVDAIGLVTGYITGNRNQATNDGFILANNQRHAGATGTGYVASRNASINATGADDNTSSTVTTGGTVWTA